LNVVTVIDKDRLTRILNKLLKFKKGQLFYGLCNHEKES